MQLSSTVNDGMVQTLDRLCASTTNMYSYKNKMADFNDALDWYCQLAFKSDGQWTFDDINQTSPPIDTQNLVSGTNRYKVSSFTEKILDLVKLEILDSASVGHILIPERIDSLGTNQSGMSYGGVTSGVVGTFSGQSFQQMYLDAPSGLPTNYLKYGDFIYLRPKPNYSLTSALKAYFNRTALKFTFTTFTVTSASPAVFTAVAHGLVAGDTVILETDGALYTGLAVDTQYYVISAGLTADAFELSASLGGSALNTSGSQSGTHCFLKTSTIPGIPLPHHMMLCRRAATSYLSYTNSFKLGDLPAKVARDEQDIKDYFSKRGKDIRSRMTFNQSNTK